MNSWIKLDDHIDESPKLMGLSAEAQLLYVYALAYCNRNLTDGFLAKQIPSKLLAGCQGLASAQNTIEEILKRKLWVEHEEAYEIVSYLEHQRSKKQIKTTTKKRQIAGRKGGVARAKQTASKPLAKSKQNSSQPQAEQEEEQELLTTTKAVVNERHEIRELCERLASKIKARDPKAKADGTSAAWLDECRKLIDLDGRTVEEIATVIDWSQADSFWHKNILSMPKLRKKFDQLWAAANAPAVKPGDDGDDWAGFQEWANE